MSEHIESQSRAETRRSTPDAAALAGAPVQQAFPGVVSGTSILALQRAIGNKATVGVLQRGGTYNPKQMAMMASQKARAADAEREGAEARKKAAEFNAARATIDRDPRYQKMVADSSSKKQKVLDAVSGALKGSMAQAWEAGDRARGYGGESAGAFAGPSPALGAYMEGNTSAHDFATEQSGAYEAEEEARIGDMAVGHMKSVIPGGGYALTAGATIAKLAIKKKIGRADTVRLNRVLVRYLMGEPAAPPVGAEQLNFEKARATVASHWGTYLSQFAEIEEIEREKLPPFPAPAAPTELVSEVDTETDWDAIPTRGRR